MVKPSITRREFIGTTAAVGTGLMLASGAKVFGQAKSANSKINIALIGFGAQGRVLLESLLKIDSIHLVAIVDIWDYARTYGERYLKKMGVDIHAYENYQDLLAHEKDLQAIAESLAIPVGTVKSRLSRLVDFFKKGFGHECEKS